MSRYDFDSPWERNRLCFNLIRRRFRFDSSQSFFRALFYSISRFACSVLLRQRVIFKKHSTLPFFKGITFLILSARNRGILKETRVLPFQFPVAPPIVPVRQTDKTIPTPGLISTRLANAIIPKHVLGPGAIYS